MFVTLKPQQQSLPQLFSMQASPRIPTIMPSILEISLVIHNLCPLCQLTTKRDHIEDTLTMKVGLGSRHEDQM